MAYMTVLSTDGRSSSITRSFRFESDVLDVLDEEAKRMGISVNALVGIILRRYVEFTRYLSKIDMIVINREMLTSLIDLLDDNAVHELGIKLGQTVLDDTVMFWKKETTDKTVLEYIEKMVCRYGHLGTYDERRMPSGELAIVVRHRLGKNGSRFLEGYLQGGLKKTLDIDGVFEITDSSVKCQIPAKR
jgi:hypothetical protein